MAGAATAFSEMPVEFQRVLEVAEQRHGIRVTPLDRLVGGWSGASIHLVSVQRGESARPEHCVLKLDRKRPSARSGEADRHAAALAAAPAAFAGTHMADMVFEPVEQDGAVAIFYRIAGQSLQRFRPLGSYQRQSQLSALFAATTTELLDAWNPEPAFRRMPPAELLRTWLAFRLKPDGHLDAFLRDVCRVDPAVPGFLVGGTVLRNPLAYARDGEHWAAAREIDAMLGSQHGDLNTNNLLVRLDEGAEAVDGYYLIDFAAFQAGMPLLYDQRYLEMSYLVLAMARVPFPSTAALITRLAEADVPDPYRAPVETAGPTAVLAAARRAFGAWAEERHPSLHDDLWAQYWLAGVAAGLAYCHKPGLPDEPRLAGLLYAAANLERYAAAFPLPAPTEVRMLVGEGRLGDAAAPGSGPPDRAAPLDLPAQGTPFLGREAELAQGKALLLADDVRLLTLLGPGGIGKTRLALQLAAETGRAFSDGAVFVDLAAAREPEEVLAAVARAVGLRTAGDRPLLETVPAHLADRRMLLVLDNFEQALSAAPAVAELIRACPRVTLLVTSREALHLRGERLLPVPVLPIPDRASGPLTAVEAGRFEAVRFFAERAAAVRPDFTITDDNAQAVAEICRRLDGLPLALELAAARTTLLPPQALLERLSRPLTMLRGGPRDLPARQQTLRDAIDWSHGLLDPDEQRLFALLSVFSGGSLAAVEAVARAVGLAERLDVLDGVTSLLDKSLLRPLDPTAAVPRVGMLQTIRDYATERLEAQPDLATAVREAHAVHFADAVRDHVQRLGGPERKAALRELEADVDDLRTAWQHWVAAGDLERLRTMTIGLWALYDERGWYAATAALTTDLLRVLATTPSTPERSQEEILLQTSLARVLLATKGYTQEVEAAYARAIELCESYGHQAELLPALRGLANLYAFITDFEKGARVGEQILALAEARDDAGMRVEGHLVIASCIFGADPKGGLEHLERALADYDPERHDSRRYHLGNDPGVPCLTTSALLLWMLGYPERARERADQAIALTQRLGHPYSTAYAAFHMGLLHLWLGEPEIAERLAGEGLRIATAQGFEIWRALALCIQGAALAEQGRGEEGLALVERGVGRYRRLRTPPVFWPLLLFVRARVFQLAGRLEQAMSLVDEALAMVEPSGADPQVADMLRLKGELLLATSADRAEEAERWFQRAIDVARERDVRTMELRAATSLARLWRAQGRTEESRRLVGDALDRLPEGRNTADAREASALLVP